MFIKTGTHSRVCSCNFEFNLNYIPINHNLAHSVDIYSNKKIENRHHTKEGKISLIGQAVGEPKLNEYNNDSGQSENTALE